MKERPIIFSGPMVRAILEGRKTMTRRVVKPQPKHMVIEGVAHLTIGFDPADDGQVWYDADCINPGRAMRCPYGRIGDRLWVKETWAVHKYYDGRPGNGCGPIPEVVVECRESPNGVTILPRRQHCSLEEERGRWRASIHMPRWASRITLEIVSVGVQRVQDISEEDAKAEGVDWVGDGGSPYGIKGIPSSWGKTAKHAYSVLWDSINSDRGFGWNVNPWVWAITFKVVEAKR